MASRKSRRRAPRGRRRRVHTKVWDRCVREVSRRGRARSAPAVCTQTLGRRGILKSHRRNRRRRRTVSGQWVILARKPGKPAQVYHGDRFVSELKRAPGAVRFPSVDLAAQFARHLKRIFPTKLKGWRLRVTQLHPQVHPNADL